jgi:V-type H+-transporting ATPase subunit a
MTFLFGTTKWVCNPDDPTASEGCKSSYTTGLTFGGTYAFGIDPIWHGTKAGLYKLNAVYP